MQEAIKVLNERLIKDVEGMPWGDPHMTGGQYRESVKYFIKAYTNDVLTVAQSTLKEVNNYGADLK